MAPQDRKLLIALVVFFSGLAFGSLFYVLFGNRLIEAMYRGESVEFLNELMRNHRLQNPAVRTLDNYFLVGRLLFSRILLIYLAIGLVVIASLRRRQVWRIVKEFFTAATHPLNLAIFRIVFFFTLFRSVDIPYTVWFSHIPTELQVAPTGLAWLLPHLPINETWVTLSCELLLFFCLTGMLGLFARTSALCAAILGCYVHGVPSFFGKVNHDHHLIWFAALLATSRCGDALSCDALFSAWKRADQGTTDPPGSSCAYALPLRFVWLLLGLIYFFPGFWKWWNGGLTWAFSDNLKFHMYSKWMEFPDWTPFFRIDQYPLLYQLGAIGTIAFEMSFIFLIFFPRLRLFAPLGGIVFHNMTNLFLGIFFLDLIRCYVSFVDWSALFRRAGCFLYKEQMQILYDGNCRLCRRTIALLRVFDIFGRVTYVNMLDKEQLAAQGLLWLDSAALMTDMHAVVHRQQWTGFAAYRALAARIPILWPFLPFLYLWPLPTIGARIYRHVADSRVCTVAEAPARRPYENGNLQLSATAVLGSVLLLGNTFCGITGEANAWPFACYPTFDEIMSPEVDSIEVVVLEAAGKMLRLDKQGLGRKFSHERFRGFVQHILHTRDPVRRSIRFRALWRLWTQHDANLQSAARVQFYKVTLSTIPERRSENPLRRELLFEMDTTGPASLLTHFV